MNHGLLPLVDQNCKVLILGSFPGEESLLKQQYYASSTNDFWKLIFEVVGVELNNFSYEHKKQVLLDAGIGLWDVFSSCERIGSMDSKIIDPVPNNLGLLNDLAPSLRLICFNGKKAGTSVNSIRNLGYETIVLPSSSGANRRDMEGRLNNWLKLKDYLD